MIGNVLQADLEEIIKSKNWDELRDALSELPPVDIAEVLIDLPVEDEGVIFRVLPRKLAALVFSYLPLDRQEELLHCFSNEQVRNILDHNTNDRTLFTSFLFTYRVNSGTVFYTGFDGNFRQGDRIDPIVFPETGYRRTNRSVFAKLQYLYRM